MVLACQPAIHWFVKTVCGTQACLLPCGASSSTCVSSKLITCSALPLSHAFCCCHHRTAPSLVATAAFSHGTSEDVKVSANNSTYSLTAARRSTGPKEQQDIPPRSSCCRVPCQHAQPEYRFTSYCCFGTRSFYSRLSLCHTCWPCSQDGVCGALHSH